MRTIQSKLFISYSALILGMIAVFVTSYYISTSKTLENKASESIHQLSTYISSQIDAELKNMDMASQKITFSNTLKELFYSDLSKIDNVSTIYNQRKFNDIVYSIMGPQMPVLQINIINMNGNYIGSGSYPIYTTLPVGKTDSIKWIREALQKDGKKHIVGPHTDDWGNFKKNVISLCRAFGNDWGMNVDSVIEVQQDYEVISEIIKNATKDHNGNASTDKQVYILNGSGNLIYPLSSSATPEVDKTDLLNESQLYWKKIKSNKSLSKELKITNNKTDKRYIAVYTKSDYSGWTVLLSESEISVLEPVVTFRNNILLASLLILFITLALSFAVSKSLTNPIKGIHRSIKNLSLETLTPKHSNNIKSDLNELEELNLAFMEMCSRLKASLEDAVVSRSHEIQARMLALQSQMNPHFLYNILAIISIHAEKNGQNDIVKMCSDLSEMLRYIASEAPQNVTISEELSYTIRYLDLMKKRYPRQFECTIDLPPQMYDIMIPKLVIQPLVENCFKYAINVKPPWHISITGICSGNNWRISVVDNGPGFEESVLESLNLKTSDISFKPQTSQKSLKGIGLINILTRLKLAYDEWALFEAVNNNSGGANVTIGGYITREADADE